MFNCKFSIFWKLKVENRSLNHVFLDRRKTGGTQVHALFYFRISLFVLEIFTFFMMPMRKVMTLVVILKQRNFQSRIHLEILKQCSFNLAPEMNIT